MPVTGMPIASAAATAYPTKILMHLGGDVVDRGALMEIGGAANTEPNSFGQYIIQLPTGIADRRLGEVVERDARLTAGGRRASSALGRNQVPHAVLPRADDLGGHP